MLLVTTQPVGLMYKNGPEEQLPDLFLDIKK